MIRSDFHIHTHFSGDSDADINEIVKTAVSQGLQTICITDHQDFDFYAEGILYELDSALYFHTLCEAAQRYASLLTIRIGVETGLEPDKAEKLHQFVTGIPFDFVIGSSHLIKGADPYYPEFFAGKDDDPVFTEYFESILDNLTCCHDFDVYGHLDYIVRYSPRKSQNYSYEKYHVLIDAILKKLISMEKGIELNTCGYRNGLNEPNPCRDVIKRYRELGGEIITIGSDAHKPSDIGHRFTDAEEILRSCGFHYYTVFKERKPAFLKL